MGLREQKKQETRQRISQVATELFYMRGFDAVTVEEVAAAANVSKMTVFNYFVRKEDLFFDREDEVKARLRAALTDRKKNESPVAALHHLVHSLFEASHPFARLTASRAKFWKVVRESPALSKRAREFMDEAVVDLATALGGAHADGVAWLIAGMVLATWRAAYIESMNELPNTKRADAAFLEVIDRGFGAIAVAAKGTPYGSAAKSSQRPSVLG